MNDMQWAPIGSEPLPPPLPPTRVDFTGNRTEFRKLVTKGALLELVTFGFYRFWLVTDIRRHLWANTAVDGDAAEYTGRAKELLVGFLFALAILVPIYLAYFLVGIEFERVSGRAHGRRLRLRLRPEDAKDAKDARIPIYSNEAA